MDERFAHFELPAPGFVFSPHKYCLGTYTEVRAKSSRRALVLTALRSRGLASK